MTWTAYYDTTTKALRSLGTVAPSVLPPGLSTKDFGETRPEGAWNSVTLEFDPITPKRIIPARDFIQRLTPTEYVAIIDDTDATTRYIVEQVKSGEPVNLASAVLDDALDHLIARGHITAQRKVEITA